MKLILSILISFTLLLSSSKDRYLQAMTKGVSQVNTLDFNIENKSEIIKTSNLFYRIYEADQTNWLPCYYYSFINVKLSFLEEDLDLKDEYLDNSLALLESSESFFLYKDNEIEKLAQSELLTLYGMIMTAKIFIDPMSRGRKYGTMSQEYLDKAEQLNPKNPRPYLIKGQSKFYTPAAFGGGADKALPLLEKSLNCFKEFEVINYWPEWGQDDCQFLYDKALNDSK